MKCCTNVCNESGEGYIGINRKRGMTVEMTAEERCALKSRIETVLSEILSDKHDCKVTLKFIPKEGACENEKRKTA